MSGPIESEDCRRGPLTEGHALPSPGDQPGNSPVTGGTGTGPAMYEAGQAAYNGNQAASRSDRVSTTGACESVQAVARWTPPPGMQADARPRPVNPSSLTGHAPGE